MRTLLARYRAKPGRGDVVEDGLRRMAEAVARSEPACVVYRASRSIDDPDVFVLYEEYVDEDALLAHRETPHFLDLVEGIVVPALETREREILAPILDAPAAPEGR
ncbi:MAG: putative quinol monooxygenase [Actinomycetota bacterium]